MRHTLIWFVIALPSVAASQAPDTAVARRVFSVARAMAAEDGGRLWGRSLDGPLLLAARSGQIVANAPDTEGALSAAGPVWTGVLPANRNPANTSLEWSGRHWIMLLWPVPADSFGLRALIAHESWHRVQADLGFPTRDPSNAHLDEGDARVWLRLETRALARALEASGASAKAAALDALRFRAARHARFPGADTSESAVELHEGLAQYTGARLSGRAPAVAWAHEAGRLRKLESEATVVRTFAYYTGPAYGLLLDMWRPEWRLEAPRATSLASLLAQELGGVRLTGPAHSATARYGEPAIRAEERARSEHRAERRRELTARFVAGPALRLPLRSMGMGFDPGRVEPLDTLGTVYGGMLLTDKWGVLDAPATETLLNPTFTEAVVGAGADFDGSTLAGPGWTLQLNPGWRVAADPKRGGWVVTDAPR